MHGLKVCRQLQYFVDPGSLSVLELGTREHPYKNVNLAINEIFNFLTNMDVNVTVSLARNVDHYLMHSKVALYNVTHVLFEPYNPNGVGNGEDEYNILRRTKVIIKDNGLSWTTPTTRFLLLSYYQLDSGIFTTLGIKIQETMLKRLAGLNIINTGVEFRNFRFEDDYSYISYNEAIIFNTYRLENKQLAMYYVDLKLLGIILRTINPMNFYAHHIKIIDYSNVNKGFLFLPE